MKSAPERRVFQTHLAEKNQLTPNLLELVIRVDDPPQMQFQAGQFALLHVPHESAEVTRSYSYASAESQSDQFKLLIKVVPGGIGSTYLANANVGDKLKFTAPFGKLLFEEPPSQQVLFVNTGAGLSQHMSFLLSKCPKHPDTEFKMLIGVWNEGELFYQDELETAKKAIQNFTYEFVIDKPIRDWQGKTGFVTNYLDDFNFLNIDSTFYLCGNPAMIKSVRDHLKKHNFDRKRIHAEAFV